MRKKVIAGNWKMHKNIEETIDLISGIKNGLTEKENVEVIVCPPYTSLETAHALLKETNIGLGAQNMHYEDNGAFTAEISADMLKSVGCTFVILGHSERRTIFGENDEMINKKIKKAFSSGLDPIFCVGETLEEREAGTTNSVIEEQIRNGLKDVTADEMKNLIIAYEPVWAIGTGRTASPEQAQEVHEFIRNLIAKLYDMHIADNIIIQYGGSVKPENSSQLLTQKDIDGALVGGACLKPDTFLGIIHSV